MIPLMIMKMACRGLGTATSGTAPTCVSSGPSALGAVLELAAGASRGDAAGACLPKPGGEPSSLVG